MYMAHKLKSQKDNIMHKAKHKHNKQDVKLKSTKLSTNKGKKKKKTDCNGKTETCEELDFI